LAAASMGDGIAVQLAANGNDSYHAQAIHRNGSGSGDAVLDRRSDPELNQEPCRGQTS
jgi:hypothetical protein